MPGYGADVRRSEVVTVDGRDVLVTVQYDQIRVLDWQMGGSTQVGVHAGGAWGFTATSAGGRAVAATTGINDGVVRRWDLAGRPARRARRFQCRRRRPAVSTAVVDGRVCLIAHVVAPNQTQVFDFVTGEPVVTTNATGEVALLDGAAVLVDIAERLEVVDLHTGPWCAGTTSVEGRG